MKKIPTIFNRNPENRKEILSAHNRNCAWVFAGEGVPTRKYDGTCCRVKDEVLYKRLEIKKGKPQPEDFELEDFDEITGKAVGWMPVTDSKEDKWHVEAFATGLWTDGTYELCGPKVQGNPEKCLTHVLVKHSTAYTYDDIERTYDGIRSFLNDKDIEGLVFHHPDGRMAKIKKRDYGQPRKAV